MSATGRLVLVGRRVGAGGSRVGRCTPESVEEGCAGGFGEVFSLRVFQ